MIIVKLMFFVNRKMTTTQLPPSSSSSYWFNITFTFYHEKDKKSDPAEIIGY